MSRRNFYHAQSAFLTPALGFARNSYLYTYVVFRYRNTPSFDLLVRVDPAYILFISKNLYLIRPTGKRNPCVVIS